MGRTVTNKLLMEKMHKQKITVDGDESVQQFLNSKSPNTAKLYHGDLKKYILFLKETKRDYSTLSEYLDRVYQVKRQNFELSPSKRKYFGETELQEFIKWLEQNGQSGRTVKRTGSTILSYLKCYARALWIL